LRTSYNGNIRGVYAGIGYRYDEQLDVFVPPEAEAN
jgi:phage shock protein PspC (stress-responsive transcriptional regulator)